MCFRLSILIFFSAASLAVAAPVKVATFSADVTPPIGAPLCFGYIAPAKTVEEPLTARGIVIFGPNKPIVLCVADFVGLYNETHNDWRNALAEAASTTPDRVAMHVIHNHDSPGFDRSASAELNKQNLSNILYQQETHDKAIADTAAVLREALPKSKLATHIGISSVAVEKFASNRRIIGEDGKIALSRMSSCRNEEAIAAPVGTIDPDLDMITFWNGDEPLAALTFYASHPQSYYGRGGVTPDTVGLARNQRTKETGVFHIHFDGAGGNIAAGKYNDGSPEARQALTTRIHAAMKSAWDAQSKTTLQAEDIAWKNRPTKFPWHNLYTEAELYAELSNPDTSTKDRIRAARDLVYLRRWKEGEKIDLQCLHLGPTRSLFFPGELFVEYQLAAKAMHPDEFITLAAYGNGGVGYIGTAASYAEGGYEVSRVSRTAPEVEAVLMQAIKELLATK